MRAAAMLALASGCVLASPDGAEQSWPPPLGITVEAVVAGDLDGNGSSEIVVLSSGEDHQQGMYLLDGERDLVFPGAQPAQSFSQFVPYDFAQPPLAALYMGGGAPNLYVAEGESRIRLHRFDSTLVELDEVETMIDAGPTLLWLETVTFPGNMPRVAVGNGSLIDHTPPDFREVRPFPAPGGPTWNIAQTITSYASGAEQIVVVATAMDIHRAPLPGPGGATQFVWTAVRQQGPSWLGQTAADLDGDGREEILGFDFATKSICVVDPGATPPVTPACTATGSMAPGGEVTIIAGVNFTMMPAPDLVIAQANANETRFTVLEDYTYESGTLSSPRTRPLQYAGRAHARSVVVSGGPGTPNALVAFDADGTAGCVIGPC